MTDLRLYNLLHKYDKDISMDNSDTEVSFYMDTDKPSTCWRITLDKKQHKMVIHGQIPDKVLHLCTRYNNTKTSRKSDSLYDVLRYDYNQILSDGAHWGYHADYGCLDSKSDSNFKKYGLHDFYLDYSGDVFNTEKHTHFPSDLGFKYAHVIEVDTRDPHNKKVIVEPTTDGNGMTIHTEIPDQIANDIGVFLKCVGEINFRKAHHKSVMIDK